MPTPRIDSHQHFWRYQAAEYGWIDDGMAALRRDFLPPELKREMDATGIAGCVLVQVRQSLEETRQCLDLADDHSFVLGVVGWVDLESEQVERDLEGLTGRPKLAGIRHIAQSEPEGFFLRPSVLRGIRALGRFDLPYDLLVYERQLPDAIALVSRCPDQRFVLDHLGKPDIRHGDIRDWRRDLSALAAFPNVACKLSGLVTEADWSSWTPAALRPYLETAADCFGAGRLLIGSDWPVCTLAASYADTIGLVTDLVSGWPAADRDAVLGGNAARIYRLDRG